MGLFGGGSGLGDRGREDEAQWMPVSDLMAGVMLVFLFIAVAFMLTVDPKTKAPDAAEAGAAKRLTLCLQGLERCGAEQEGPAGLQGISADIADVLRQWQKREADIHAELMKEFESDLPGWGAEIEKHTMLVRFRSEVLFAKGSSELKPDFQEILDNFFPRYIAVLEPFEPFLEEIRIEGHTSSEWGQDTPPEEAYIRNMDLSQKRTRSVLGHGLSLLDDEGRQWVRPLLTANGLSSSRTVAAESGAEDPKLSRRVEFRVHTRLRDELEAVDALLKASQERTDP